MKVQMLPTRIVVYLPSLDRNGRSVRDRQDKIQEFIEYCFKEQGITGATVNGGNFGYWKDEDGKVVDELVATVTMFVNRDTFGLQELRDALAEYVIHKFDRSAVSVEVDDRMYVFSREDE